MAESSLKGVSIAVGKGEIAHYAWRFPTTCTVKYGFDWKYFPKR